MKPLADHGELALSVIWRAPRGTKRVRLGLLTFADLALFLVSNHAASLETVIRDEYVLHSPAGPLRVERDPSRDIGVEYLPS